MVLRNKRKIDKRKIDKRKIDKLYIWIIIHI